VIDGRGHLHVDDTMWRIIGPDLPEGAKVTVTDVEGVMLRVALGDPEVRVQDEA
jgi:membrane protein implicated in regulation of membrane protease activity